MPKAKKKKRANWKWLIFVPVLAVCAWYFYQAYDRLPNKTIFDIFAILIKQGYTPNEGLSNEFMPGTIIQVTDKLGPDGKERLLPTPLIFGWPSDCFPGKIPKNHQYLLPQVYGRSSANLTIGADLMNDLAPELHLESEAITDYTLTLNNPQVLTLAKGELSADFSPKCVQSLSNALKSGDKMEWFRVILSVIAADSLTMEIDWKANTSADVRKGVTRKAGQALARIAHPESDKDSSAQSRLTVDKEDYKKTVLSSNGLVVIAYHSRPLQPQMGN
jgi:hypothetical protein